MSKNKENKLSNTQAAIAACVLTNAKTEEEFDIFEFPLSDSDAPFVVANARIKNDEARLLFNLPSKTNGVFCALTFGNEKEAARILANLEDYERDQGSILGLGEAVVINDSTDVPLASKAVLLLRTATSLDIKNIPDSIDLDGKNIKFFLAILLNAHEYEYRKQFGHDALLDSFSRRGKSIFMSDAALD